MSQYKAIPQPTDQRSVSQNDLLTNMQYLQTPINPTPGVPNGVINVDHFSTGDNVAQPRCGFHNQVSFIRQITPPTNLTNAVNGRDSNGILYVTPDGSGTNQLRFLNLVIDQPISYSKAMVIFNSSGIIVGNNFNVSSVGHPSVGVFRVNFNVLMPSVDYLVFAMSSNGNSSSAAFAYGYTRKQVNSVDINIVRTNLGSIIPFDAAETCVIVLGLF